MQRSPRRWHRNTNLQHAMSRLGAGRAVHNPDCSWRAHSRWSPQAVQATSPFGAQRRSPSSSKPWCTRRTPAGCGILDLPAPSTTKATCASSRKSGTSRRRAWPSRATTIAWSRSCPPTNDSSAATRSSASPRPRARQIDGQHQGRSRSRCTRPRSRRQPQPVRRRRAQPRQRTRACCVQATLSLRWGPRRSRALVRRTDRRRAGQTVLAGDTVLVGGNTTGRATEGGRPRAPVPAIVPRLLGNVPVERHRGSGVCAASTSEGDERQEREEWHLSETTDGIRGYYDRTVRRAFRVGAARSPATARSCQAGDEDALHDHGPALRRQAHTHRGRLQGRALALRQRAAPPRHVPGTGRGPRCADPLVGPREPAPPPGALTDVINRALCRRARCARSGASP